MFPNLLIQFKRNPWESEPSHSTRVQSVPDKTALFYMLLMHVCSIDDECQFWLDKTIGVLISPYFDDLRQQYGHNLNCTWTLTAKEGFYLNLEIDSFDVNNDKYIISTTFFKMKFKILA